MHEIACFPFNATTHYTITDLREEVGGLILWLHRLVTITASYSL